ncbi:MAG: ATP-binding cassette domain-containing protein [Candidatus Methanoplasma sp.]|jgi:ABC-type lipoprotein export system ATPase subunit|nr:ATP-binding cassette domain-containing protein [Candidatus Methanoplasma sp.]
MVKLEPIETLTIFPGRSKSNESENFEPIVIKPGDIISVVGPTGSGKTAFINDIEVFAQNDTVTGRRVLVNGKDPPEEFVRDPAHKPISSITQNTKCLADLSVGDFIKMHIRARKNGGDDLLDKTIEVANRFTGENIDQNSRLAALSGGQTRSLLIADAIVISNAPILLLDEIENAGIYKDKVIESLRELKKSVIFVTHDPYISLLSDRRIVMGNGAVRSVITSNGSEKATLEKIGKIDAVLSGVRERIRSGEIVSDLEVA